MDRPLASTSNPRLSSTALAQPSTSPTASRVPSDATLQSRQRNSSGNLSGGGVPLPSEKRVARTSVDSLSAKRGPTPPVSSSKVIKKDDSALLTTLQSEFESLRSLLTCKICYCLLYEPYTTSCGHTYCYSCLCKSFVPNTPKTCPECRTRLFRAPAPSFLIRELTHTFIKKAELLPEDETAELHAQMKQEQAEKIQTDKSAPHGLFKGYFGPGPMHFRARSVSWSPSDSVDENECPICYGPLDENGQCPDCTDNELAGTEYNPFPMEILYPGSEAATEDMSDMYTVDEPDWEDHPDWEDNPTEEDEFDALGEITMEQQMWFHERGMPLPPSAVLRAGSLRSSLAGSRTGSYASSIQDYQESEMGTLEEEDEEEDGDSVMAGSDYSSVVSHGGPNPNLSGYPSNRSTPVDLGMDGELSNSSATRRRRRTDSTTPTPSMSQPSRRRRIRGPSGSISTSRASSQTSGSSRINVDTRHETLPEAFLRQHGRVHGDPRWEHSSISRQSVDGEGEDEDEMADGDESDGARTTVGWDSNTNSNNRSRTGGSLTPTADQPYPTVRPRTSRAQLNNRGLRRRTSVLSTAPSHQEENDADDDVSDDTDTSNRTSRRELSDSGRQRSIDPHLQSLFADIQQINTDTTRTNDQLEYLRYLNRTPLARPRTANRNRTTTPSSQSTRGTLTPLSSRSTIHHRANQNAMIVVPRPELQHLSYSDPSFYPTTTNMASYADSVGRPDSRVGNRPPSASGRRTPGWNASRSSTGNNPFVRPRQSNRALREQSSTATLRPVASTRTLRGQSSRVSMRGSSQSSPQSIRNQPRQHRTMINEPPAPQIHHSLNHTPSVMHLPQSIGQTQQLQSGFRSPPPHAGQMRDYRSVSGPSGPTQPVWGGRAGGNDTRNRVLQVMEERREAIARRRETTNDDATNWNQGQAAQSAATSNPFHRRFTAAQGLSHLRHPPGLAPTASPHGGGQRSITHGVRSPLNASLGMSGTGLASPSPSQIRRQAAMQNADFLAQSALEDITRAYQVGLAAANSAGRGTRGNRGGMTYGGVARA